LSFQKIIGYRAPSFSLSKDTEWIFRILKKHGIIYDSSIASSLFRSGFKYEEGTPACFEIGEGVQEFPITCLKQGPFEIPMGGGYFRAFPYGVTKKGLNNKNKSKKDPTIFYIHPWELDKQQPRIKMSYMKKIRHYLNISNAEEKMKRLLSEEKFISIKDFIKNANKNDSK